MKFPLVRIALLAMLALVTVGGPAAAQTRDDVQAALDRTDELISRAQDVVTGAGNAQADAELAAAIQLQTDARAAFVSANFRLSLDLTMRARLRADRAIALVRNLPDPDRVLVQLERTRELLDRARERIEECGHDRARAMLRAAFEIQLRAEASAKEGRYLAALQLTMSARERALRAMRLCNVEENLRESAERALNRTDELITRAKDLVADHGNEQARRALERAVDLQGEAWVQFRAEHYDSALRLTQSARTFAHRAIRLAGGR
ncbi:MAG TPA: hypothetical protein VJV75_09480 [Candidatus Polarisedimenticolia bacterium]|nr:hypothetical protein [Candidatus Polarisedimenticolia bacterium]